MGEESFYFIIKKNQILKKKILVLEGVWEYGYGYFLKYFSLENILK
jgi:hypothetical protein